MSEAQSAKSQAIRETEARSRLALEISELVYDAAVEPVRWQAVVEALSSACGGAGVAVVLRIARAGVPSHAFRHRLDPALSGVFNAHLRRGLPWTSASDPDRYVTAFQRGNHYFPDAEIAATDFYREYMRPQGLAAVAPIAHSISGPEGHALSALAIYQREGDRSFEDADLELLNTLVPHLARANRIYCRLHGEREQRRALAEVVDRFPMGVLLLDADGRCTTTNASAERILSLNDGISLDHERPSATSERVNEALHETIARAAEAASREGVTRSRVIAVDRPSGGPPFTMALRPLRRSKNDPQLGEAVAAVFIADPNAGKANPKILRDLYELTPAESELVGELVTGRALDEIATRRGIRISTARGYLKSAYRKTGTNSQHELVRLVLTGVSPIDSSPHPR